MTEITADLLLHAYSQGVFPMAESALSKEIYWVDPDMRGIIPLDNFHISKKLARKIKQCPFEVKVDSAFVDVMKACAIVTNNTERENTWINPQIVELYTELFDMGFAHSVECWLDDKLVGGLYGVSIGGAFCGESMFHTVSDASKIALVYLVSRLRLSGYQLLDTQFITDHLSQFGAVEIPRENYKDLLDKALEAEANFYSASFDIGPERVLQSITHTS